MPREKILPLNRLERDVLARMFESFGINISHIETLHATSRDYTGAGVYTEIPKQLALEVPADFTGDKWLDLGGRLNSNVEVGFIIYVQDRFVSCIEAYTYDKDWPERIHGIEIFPLDEVDD